jgi:hypothetical protein
MDRLVDGQCVRFDIILKSPLIVKYAIFRLYTRKYLKTQQNTIMATRILVIYKSHEIPGDNKDKSKLIANLACQSYWGRDFNTTKGDRQVCEGDHSFYNQRCFVLVDNGPVEAVEQEVLLFKWKGQHM